MIDEAGLDVIRTDGKGAPVVEPYPEIVPVLTDERVCFEVADLGDRPPAVLDAAVEAPVAAAFIRATTLDNPHLPPDYIENLRREDRRQALLLDEGIVRRP